MNIDEFVAAVDRLSDEIHCLAVEHAERLAKTDGMAIPIGALADTLYALRVSCEYLASSKVLIEKMLNICTMAQTIRMVEQNIAKIPDGDRARAFTKVSHSVRVPSRSKEPEQYAALCEALGVPNDELTRLHFPTIKEQLSKLIKAGDPVPEHLAQFQLYSQTTIVTAPINKLSTQEDAADSVSAGGYPQSPALPADMPF